MNWLLPLVMLIFLPFSLLAQEQSTFFTQGKSGKIEVTTESTKAATDSLTKKSKRKLNRLQAARERAEAKLAKRNPQHKVTELNQKARHKLDSLNPTNKVNAIMSRADSLNPERQMSGYQHKLDSLHGRLTSKIDSLTRLPNPDRYLIKSLDSLRGGLDSLRSSGVVKELHGAGEKVKQAQANVNQKLKAWQDKVNSKLSPFKEHGGNVGGVKLPEVSLPGAGINLPNVNLPNSIPSIGVNANVDINLPQANLPGAELPSSPGLPNVKTPNTSLPGLGGMDKKLGSVSELSGKVNGYTQDTKELTSGNLEKIEQLPKTMEEKVMELDALEDAQKEMTEGIDYAEMMKKWNSDPDVARELALNKAKQEATSHFAGHEEELKAAMQQLAKLKAKKPDAEGVIDLFKPRQNDLKGKPFRDRLLPGLSLQFQNSTNQWFDFNLYLGYRISGKITAGAGWVERISEDLKEWEYHPEERAYGPRVFGEFKIKGGLHARAEAEYLNAQVTSPYLKQQDVTGRAWVWSYFAGMKQSFNYSKLLKGNVQVMYNLYNPEKRSPYVSRLNVRIGIEIPMKKPAAEKITTH